jgi:hypothetical protein
MNKFHLPKLPEGGATVTPNADAAAKASANAAATATERKGTSMKLDVETKDVETRRGKTNADDAVTEVENEVKIIESAVAAVCGDRAGNSGSGNAEPTRQPADTTDLKQRVSDIIANRPTLPPGATWTTRPHSQYTRPTQLTHPAATPQSRPADSPRVLPTRPDATRKRDNGANADADETEEQDAEIETARREFMSGQFVGRDKVPDLVTTCTKLRQQREGGAPAPTDNKMKRDQGSSSNGQAADAEDEDAPSKGVDDENTRTVTNLVDRFRAHCGVDFKSSTDANVAGVGAMLDQACKDAANRVC